MQKVRVERGLGRESLRGLARIGVWEGVFLVIVWLVVGGRNRNAATSRRSGRCAAGGGPVLELFVVRRGGHVRVFRIHDEVEEANRMDAISTEMGKEEVERRPVVSGKVRDNYQVEEKSRTRL